MTAPNVEPDGNLPAALVAFRAAITNLTEPIPGIHNGKLVKAPSLYMQLRDAISGEQSNAGNGGGAKSQLPVWTDALVLIQDIDLMVAVWQPGFTGVPPTVARLRMLSRNEWRPQDVSKLDKWTDIIKSWATDIDTLFDPPHIKTLSAPCPACNATHSYRRDSAGERIRVPALTVIAEKGAQCVVCKASWAPPQYDFLRNLLGFKMPEGVLE